MTIESGEMEPRQGREPADDGRGPGREAEESGATRMKCEDIQAVLLDYMARELGTARSDLVRGHLLKCEACQAAAREMQETLDLLSSVSKLEAGRTAGLSEGRRRHLFWAISHPVLEWIHRHHVLFSLALAALIILLVVLFSWRMRVQESHSDEVLYPIELRGRPKTHAPP